MRRDTPRMQRLWVFPVLGFFFCGALFAQAEGRTGSANPAELNERASALIKESRFDEAEAVLEQALAAAREQKDLRQEARAILAQGLVHYRKAEYPSAGDRYDKALALFESLADAAGVAEIHRYRGALQYHLGDPQKSLAEYQKALAYYEQLGDLKSQAGVLSDISFTPTLSRDERAAYLHRAFELGQQLGDPEIQGFVLHNLGDLLMNEGSFVEANGNLERAAELLQKSGNRIGLARVFTSMGRLLRLHGQPERAIEMYQRAMEIQREISDRNGVIQSYNAMGVAYTAMENYRKAGECYQRGLDLAQETGSERIIDFMKGAVASNYLLLGQYQRAAELFEQVLSRGKTSAQDYRLNGLATAYYHLGRQQDALSAIEQAIALRRKEGSGELHDSLSLRAHILGKLHRGDEALADVREGMRLLEEQRARTVPADFLKRGYADSVQRYYAAAVALLSEAGREQEALRVAEQGRARAFLDLLATREVTLRKESTGEVAELRSLSTSLRNEGTDPAEFMARSGSELLARGASGSLPEGSALMKQWKSADLELRSFVAAEAFSVEQLAGTAKRLRSAILSYWVGEDKTYIWVVQPDGTIQTATSRFSRQQMAEMIHAATSDLQLPNRGEQGEDAEAPSEFTIPTRGGITLRMSPSSRQAWRKLYDALIRPVRDSLPHKSGSRITIIPHGPLFRLSFAALLDERDRYLIERHELHYAPAGAVLEFTRKKLHAGSPASARYVLVADPANTPHGDKDRKLPPLPGARAEVADTARLLPGENATILGGPAATEARVRAALNAGSVLHFAVHGIVRDDSPLDSFLALGTTSPAAAEDGRLTTQDIYELQLNADLVFLSACRSGRGKVTGDGVVGLTRSFVYAGSPSVVATLWDVADEPTRRLVPSFYRGYLQHGRPGRAMRAAQLQLLSDLRAGRVRISTPAGDVTLPEDPVLWAAFVVLGEP